MEHKVLIVGPGMISETYIDRIHKIDGMTTVGVVGRDLQKTKQYAQTKEIPIYGTDISEVTAECNATMTIICTPNATHYENVLAAAELGLDILCEKPLHIHPEKQNEMTTICHQKNLKLCVCFMRRFHRHIRYVKELLDSEKLGKIKIIDVCFKDYRDSNYYSDSSWHGTWQLDGGGPFIQQASHIIDIALWFAGGFSKVIQAATFTLLHPIEVEDHGYAVVQFANDAVGVLQASTACRYFFANQISISAERGGITVDFEGIKHWHVEGIKAPMFQEDDDVFMELLLDFKDAIESNREPFVSTQSSNSVVELIYEIYKKAGRPIKK